MLTKIRQLFERKQNSAERLYGAIVAAARQRVFYQSHGVADTVDGRFDMIVIHMFLVLERLRGTSHDSLRQSLTDTFFADMDRSLREMGAGDLSVGKKVRKMAEAFFGRIKAYGQASGEAQLTEAIRRNVFPDVESAHASSIAQYMLVVRETLAAQNEVNILEATLNLPLPKV
jgi:cytochrome b pre-mRNA-processing protein 3